jgi:hypothetical protein
MIWSTPSPAQPSRSGSRGYRPSSSLHQSVPHPSAPLVSDIPRPSHISAAATSEPANPSDHRPLQPQLPSIRRQPRERALPSHRHRPPTRGRGDVDSVRLCLRAVHLPRRRGFHPVLLPRALPPSERAVHYGPRSAGARVRHLPYATGPAGTRGLRLLHFHFYY